MKKPPQKVAYFSRNSVVSEIFYHCPFTAQQPKWQNSCSQMWLKKQLYIELGVLLSPLFIWAIPDALIIENIISVSFKFHIKLLVLTFAPCV